MEETRDLYSGGETGIWVVVGQPGGKIPLGRHSRV